MSILVFNAGSSTLKFTLFDDAAKDELAAGTLSWKREGDNADFEYRIGNQPSQHERIAATEYGAAVAQILALWQRYPHLPPVQACGHRVVHGGPHFSASVRIDAQVKQTITELIPLAPLHNPPALASIEAAQRALPKVPHVAAFDTAFFAGQEPASYVYPVPYAWFTDWGIRRFGFHGISHHYCTQRAAELLPGTSRLVICHLGNGCSASAVRSGQAVTSTMGFTPLEGLMMGTRSGSIDPNILLYLQKNHGLTVANLDQALHHESGLLGVSGVASDFRQVQTAADQGHARARLALHIFADRVRAAIGALAVTLGGLDALVFTAGVGEHSAWLRREVCRGLDCLGVRLDPDRNEQAQTDCDIAPASSAVRVLVLHTREELLIARDVLALAPNHGIEKTD